MERDPELSWKKRLSAICHLIKCSVVSKGKGGQSSNSFIMTAFVCLKECFAEVGGGKGRCGIVTLLSDFILFPFGVMLQALVWLSLSLVNMPYSSSHLIHNVLEIHSVLIISVFLGVPHV